MRIWFALVIVIGCAAQENTSSISGTVIDRSGATIPNTTITLSSSTTVEVKTDSQGKFAFSTVEPGSYKVKFQQPGFSAKTLDVTLDAGPTALGDVVLEIASLHCPVIEVVGQALPEMVGSECRGSICGSVRYGSAGVANAIVYLHLSGEPHRVKTTRTDANGIFQLGEVKPGLYDLAIKAKGWETATIDSIGLQRGRQITLPLVQLQRPSTRVR